MFAAHTWYLSSISPYIVRVTAFISTFTTAAATAEKQRLVSLHIHTHNIYISICLVYIFQTENRKMLDTDIFLRAKAEYIFFLDGASYGKIFWLPLSPFCMPFFYPQIMYNVSFSRSYVNSLNQIKSYASAAKCNNSFARMKLNGVLLLCSASHQIKRQRLGRERWKAKQCHIFCIS